MIIYDVLLKMHFRYLVIILEIGNLTLEPPGVGSMTPQQTTEHTQFGAGAALRLVWSSC